jgi:hypothetical protein
VSTHCRFLIYADIYREQSVVVRRQHIFKAKRYLLPVMIQYSMTETPGRSHISCHYWEAGNRNQGAGNSNRRESEEQAIGEFGIKNAIFKAGQPAGRMPALRFVAST